MSQYREIFTIIDSAKGTLISPDGAKISRDDLLPRLILADEVILYASFVNVKEENNVISVEPKAFDGSLAFKIIGDSDNDNETAVMFSYAYLPEKSDLATGKLAFRIKTNSTRFADALKNVRSKKCDFVILGLGTNPVTTVVLAKDQFIAENRPCENVVFEDPEPSEIMTREELQILLSSKSPINHTHSGYAASNHSHDEYALISHSHNDYASDEHTHTKSDITDLGSGYEYTAGTGINISSTGVISCTVSPGSGGVFYTAGDGISISAEGVISCTVPPGENSKEYTAGNGIEITEDNIINCTVTPGTDPIIYTAGNGIDINEDNKINIKGVDVYDGVMEEVSGLYIDDNGLHCGLSHLVTQEALGDISAILDEINGEEV